MTRTRARAMVEKKKASVKAVKAVKAVVTVVAVAKAPKVITVTRPISAEKSVKQKKTPKVITVEKEEKDVAIKKAKTPKVITVSRPKVVQEKDVMAVKTDQEKDNVAIKPVKTVQAITLMSDWVLQCRLNGIYHHIENGNYERAKGLINDTINLFNTVVVMELGHEVERIAIRNLYYALIKLATRNYIDAYRNIGTIEIAMAHA